MSNSQDGRFSTVLTRPSGPVQEYATASNLKVKETSKARGNDLHSILESEVFSHARVAYLRWMQTDSSGMSHGCRTGFGIWSEERKLVRRVYAARFIGPLREIKCSISMTLLGRETEIFIASDCLCLGSSCVCLSAPQ